jgi:predicted amidohydrolase
LLTPELSLSGYAIDDLLLQEPLLDAVEAAIAQACRSERRALSDFGRRRAAAIADGGV